MNENGTVKWYDEKKGFGFIDSPGLGDHYFHITHVEGSRSPEEGDSVTFESTINEKGLLANNVHITKRSVSNKQIDNRDQCNTCDKKMVPRPVFEDGEPTHNICPFCLSIHNVYYNPPSRPETLRELLDSLIFILQEFIIQIGIIILVFGAIAFIFYLLIL